MNHYLRAVCLVGISLSLLLVLDSCNRDYPALVGMPTASPEPARPASSTCPCPSTDPASSTTSPAISTTVSSTTSTPATPPVVVVDTLAVPPPHFQPNGGNFYMNTPVEVTADTLPPQAVIEVSADNGKTWQANQKFILTTGGTLLTRIRAGTKLSRNRAATFSLYFKRMMIIGNSIMYHPPSSPLGWFNSNGMAASAPDKDFAHLLTARMQALYPSVMVKLQSGGRFEGEFGNKGYSIDEFNQPLQEFKPDLIIIRIGENVDDTQVAGRNFETNFRQLLDRLVSYSQPVKVVCTTSVWYKPKADAVIRKVITEKGYPTLVDMSFMVGQSQCFASQYANPGVAAHPNDVGMLVIADAIWDKIQ